MKWFLLSTVIGLLATGCNSSDQPNSAPENQDGKEHNYSGSVYSRNYLQMYRKPSSMRVAQISNDVLFVSFDTGNLYHQEDTDPAIFNELSEYYGDTSYNNYIPDMQNIAVAEDFTEVNVYSNMDYDGIVSGEEPWSSSVMLCGSSPYKHIKSNYTDFHDGFPEIFAEKGMGVIDRPEYFPVYGFLNRLSTDDLKLLYTDCYLYFTRLPSKGKHLFTVHFHTADKLFEQTIELTVM